MKLLRTHWRPVLSFVVLLAIALRTILLSDRLIGHNWDFSFPYPTDLFSRIIYFSKYTWLDYNLGFVPILNLSHIVPNSAISLLGHLFGSVTATKILLIATITVGYFGYKMLLDYLIGKNAFHYVISLLFAFSPFLFNEIIGGSWYMWISYACAPLYLYATFKIVNHVQWRFIWLYLLTSFFVLSSLQNFFCISAISLVYVLYVDHSNHQRLKSLKRYGALHLILLMINSYWLVSFVATYGEFNSHVFASQKFAGGFIGVKNSLQSMITIMNGGGYLDRNMYLYVFPKEFTQVFNLAFISGWFLILYQLFIAKQKDTKGVSRHGLFWFLLFLISAFVVKGGNMPFSWLTMDIFTHFAPMRLFRSPQHLMIFPALLTPLLLAFAYTGFAHSGRRYSRLLFSSIVLLWISGWFITGDIGKSTLSIQKRDRIDLFKLSPELTAFYKIDQSDPQYRRVIFLPSVASPLYEKTPYQNEAQGVIPEYAYLRNPTLTAEDNSFARAFEYSFCGNKRINYVPYLALFGVRNIVVRGDIAPAFTDCVRRFDSQEVVKYLDADNRLHKVQSSKYLSNYEIRESSLLLPLFIPRTITSLQGTPDDLPILTSKKGYQLSDSFYLSSRPIQPSLQTTANPPHIEYKKISPSKYRVAIHHAKAAFPLVLSTNFHPLWRIYTAAPSSAKSKNGFISNEIMNITQNDNLPSGHFYDILFQPIIVSESKHQIINGYANSWRIEPYALCKHTTCTRNADGSYDMDFVIEFSLQKYFLIGWLLSALFSVIIAGRYAYSHLQKNKRT